MRARPQAHATVAPARRLRSTRRHHVAARKARLEPHASYAHGAHPIPRPPAPGVVRLGGGPAQGGGGVGRRAEPVPRHPVRTRGDERFARWIGGEEWRRQRSWHRRRAARHRPAPAGAVGSTARSPEGLFAKPLAPVSARCPTSGQRPRSMTSRPVLPCLTPQRPRHPMWPRRCGRDGRADGPADAQWIHAGHLGAVRRGNPGAAEDHDSPSAPGAGPSGVALRADPPSRRFLTSSSRGSRARPSADRASRAGNSARGGLP